MLPWLRTVSKDTTVEFCSSFSSRYRIAIYICNVYMKKFYYAIFLMIFLFFLNFPNFQNLLMDGLLLNWKEKRLWQQSNPIKNEKLLFLHVAICFSHGFMINSNHHIQISFLFCFLLLMVDPGGVGDMRPLK